MPLPDSSGPWLTMREAAAYLRVHPETLRRYVKGGRIQRYGEGKRQRYNRLDLDDYAKNHPS